MASNFKTLSCVSFNCFGMKSSSHFIKSLSEQHDICFICEHWLNPCDAKHVEQCYNDDGYWCTLKSRIDPEVIQRGRSYGGVGFICNRKSGMSYRNVDIDCDRVSVLQVMYEQRPVLTIIGVYLPFYNGSSDQIALYAETLDIIQTILSNYAQDTPVMIMGDCNAALPQNDILTLNWYKSKSFNEHSLLMYDFICDNVLTISNFAFNQAVNYTYLKGGSRTYIDHVMVTERLEACIMECTILNDCSDCASDHLPMLTKLCIPIKHGSYSNVLNHNVCPIFPRTSWHNAMFVHSYSKHVKLSAHKLNSPLTDNVNNMTRSEAQEYVNIYSTSITEILHKATEDSLQDQKPHQPRRKRQHWWNDSCKTAKNRHRFWYNIWNSCDRPRSGSVYESYKYAKHTFRKSCRLAFNSSVKTSFNMCNKYFRERKMTKFWNMIRSSKSCANNANGNISVDNLYTHFNEKFSYDSGQENNFIKLARTRVNDLLISVNDKVYSDFVFSEHNMRRFIKKLKIGCASGVDGVTSEHLKHACDSDIIIHLCQLLTVSFQYGVIPNDCAKGILVPLLKKTTLDPSVANNYRPVILSTVYSKLIEMYILEDCSDFRFSDSQFGFVKGRSTSSAISLVQDISSHFVNNGSQVYMCALDAEGAFDGIPHPVLFSKTIDVLSNVTWRLLFNWYTKISVQVKWGPIMSNIINVQKGTRQGGLTSPFLFNVLYKDLVDNLNNEEGGLCIGSKRFNVFCYADDLLLASTTVSGLQNLINVANDYVIKCGLRFNAQKTTCVINGNSPFLNKPKWYIETNELSVDYNIKYLGATIGNKCGSVHVSDRIRACRKAFYSLQGAGLCHNTLNIDTVRHVWSATCKSILLYACETMYLTKTNRTDLDKIQSKLIKRIVGIGPNYLTTPLLDALRMANMSALIDVNTMFLYRNIISNMSAATSFYMLLSQKHRVCKKSVLLTDRVGDICDFYNIDKDKFLLKHSYAVECKRKMLRFSKTGQCGKIDTIRTLLKNRDETNTGLLRLLLKAF
jgi:exonuclease III